MPLCRLRNLQILIWWLLTLIDVEFCRMFLWINLNEHLILFLIVLIWWILLLDFQILIFKNQPWIFIITLLNVSYFCIVLIWFAKSLSDFCSYVQEWYQAVVLFVCFYFLLLLSFFFFLSTFFRFCYLSYAVLIKQIRMFSFFNFLREFMENWYNFTLNAW